MLFALTYFDRLERGSTAAGCRAVFFQWAFWSLQYGSVETGGIGEWHSWTRMIWR